MVPFIIMVVLMSLIGLITSLNQQFQAPMKAAYLLMGGGLTNTLATGIVFSFFLAYLIMGPSTSKYVERKGHQQSLIFGLCVLIVAFGLYELSAFVFDKIDLPSFSSRIEEAKSIIAQRDLGVEAMAAYAAQTGNFEVNLTKMGEYSSLKYMHEPVIPVAYWVFLIAAYVAGTALTYLQAVVNPYVVACDVKGTSGVQRQTIAGAGNSAMTTIGPLIVAHLIFSGKDGLDINMTSLYIPILVLIVLVGIIAFALTRISLPGIAGTEVKEGEVLTERITSFRHLILGVVALFMYVGVEVCVGANINLYASDLGFSLSTAARMAFLYWGGMLIGRLLGSFLSKVSGQVQLAIASIGAAVLVIAAMVTGNPWILVGVGFFHSIMWPAIFALAIDGLGRYTSKGTGLLMMGVVGGAVLPLIQGTLADLLGDWSMTWLIVIVGEAYMLFYALVGSKVLKRDSIL